MKRALDLMRWRIRRPFLILKSHLKRHYHLHLMLRYEEKHWLADRIFHKQDRRNEEPKKVEGLLDSVSRKLMALDREMSNAMPDSPIEQRKFRGQFIKTMREHRGLSRAQTCRLLNSHKDFIARGRKHPSYWYFFPFDPSFIEKFEEDTPSIAEEFIGGFVSGLGFPSEDFARWLSVIYCTEEEFARFEARYSELSLKKTKF